MRFLIPLLVIIIVFFCAILMAQEYTNYYPYYDTGYYSYSGGGWGYPQYGGYGYGYGYNPGYGYGYDPWYSGYGYGGYGPYSGYGYGYPAYGGYGGGYLGIPTLGLSSLYNPLSYYSYGSGLFSPFYNFDPLSDSLLGLGMFAGALM